MRPGFYSRFGALLALIGVIVCTWILLVAPLADWRQQQLSTAKQSKLELERLESSFQRLSLQHDALANYETADLAWNAKATGEASARIQTHMAEAAGRAGIQFRSITPLPNARSNGEDQVVFRLEFESDLAQLTSFLTDIEYATPALPVTRATLRRLVRPNDQSLQPVVFTQLDIAAPVLIEDGS